MFRHSRWDTSRCVIPRWAQRPGIWVSQACNKRACICVRMSQCFYGQKRASWQKAMKLHVNRQTSSLLRSLTLTACFRNHRCIHFSVEHILGIFMKQRIHSVNRPPIQNKLHDVCIFLLAWLSIKSSVNCASFLSFCSQTLDRFNSYSNKNWGITVLKKKLKKEAESGLTDSSHCLATDSCQPNK